MIWRNDCFRYPVGDRKKAELSLRGGELKINGDKTIGGEGRCVKRTTWITENEGSRSSKGRGRGEKECGMGRILMINYQVIGPMTHHIQLARGSRGYTKFYLPGWGPQGPGPSSPCTGRGGRDDSNIVPFYTSTFCWMLCGPNVFYRI